jgi:acyl carrier protein
MSSSAGPAHGYAKGTDAIERDVLAHIKADLVSEFTGDLEPETSLEGLIDSTAIMELIVWVEDTFGFTVELDDITQDNFGSARQLARWIDKNANGGSS